MGSDPAHVEDAGAGNPAPAEAPAASESPRRDIASNAATTLVTSPSSPLPSEGDATSEDEGYASSSESDPDYAEVLDRLKELMSVRAGSVPASAAPPSPRLPSFDLSGVAELIASGRAKRVVFMCGAGISVNAGIPDFRSPGTGLYSRLEDYGLPHPQAVFEIDFFRRNPRPFFLLAKELYPGTYAPTPTHHFMRLLHDKGLLLRCYSQNIDSLERMAGLPPTAVVAAHGNFDSARCIECRVLHEVDYVREAVMAQEPCRCATGRPGCSGLVKPDIVFFGESLPKRFWTSMAEDLPQADLLIVAGTSLVVQPFASLVDRVPAHCPRLLINKERVGEADPTLRSMGYDKGFNFGEGNYRDVVFEGDCDEGVWALAEALGWAEELRELVEGWVPPEGTPVPAKKSNGVDDGIAAAAAAAADTKVEVPVE